MSADPSQPPGVLGFRARRERRKRAERLDATGHVRGFHGGCPTTPPGGFLGVYELGFDDAGHVVCEACGAHDLEVANA